MSTENPNPEIEVVAACPDRMLLIENHVFDGLSVRSTNCLSNLGIHSKKEARAALKNGRLNWRGGTKTRRFGKKSWAEVCEWAGYHPPLKYPDGLKGIKRPAKRISFKCKHCGEWNEPPFLHTLPAPAGSVKYALFTIHIPEVKPGQGVGTREIQVPVRVESGEDIITEEGHELIDRIKIQEWLKRLHNAVCELYAANQKLPSLEAKATPTETAGGGILISPKR